MSFLVLRGVSCQGKALCLRASERLRKRFIALESANFFSSLIFLPFVFILFADEKNHLLLVLCCLWLPPTFSPPIELIECVNCDGREDTLQPGALGLFSRVMSHLSRL